MHGEPSIPRPGYNLEHDAPVDIDTLYPRVGPGAAPATKTGHRSFNRSFKTPLCQTCQWNISPGKVCVIVIAHAHEAMYDAMEGLFGIPNSDSE
jgi:hypothetical protein